MGVEGSKTGKWYFSIQFIFISYILYKYKGSKGRVKGPYG